MSEAEIVILSDDDEMLEQRRTRQLPRIMDIRSIRIRRRGVQCQQESQKQQQEQPSIMMVLQALLEMQQKNQQTNQQLLQIQQQNDHRFAALEMRLERVENEKGDDGPRPANAFRNSHAAESAQAGAEVPHARPRRIARYSTEEDLRIVEYLINRNKIDRAKSSGVWEELRAEDPLIADRSVSSFEAAFQGTYLATSDGREIHQRPPDSAQV